MMTLLLCQITCLTHCTSLIFTQISVFTLFLIMRQRNCNVANFCLEFLIPGSAESKSKLCLFDCGASCGWELDAVWLARCHYCNSIPSSKSKAEFLQKDLELELAIKWKHESEIQFNHKVIHTNIIYCIIRLDLTIFFKIILGSACH